MQAGEAVHWRIVGRIGKEPAVALLEQIERRFGSKLQIGFVFHGPTISSRPGVIVDNNQLQ
jgi:hypothetical protein